MDLLPPNSTDQERALAETIDNAFESLPVELRSIWNPNTCKEHFLLWLAWAFSVDEFSLSMPDHIRRGLIKSSLGTHRIKGTRKSVEAVVQSFGADIELTEWFEQVPPGLPHTFEVLINYTGATVSSDLQESVLRAVNRTKPVRSHYVVQTGIVANATANIGAAVQVTQFIRLEFV